MLEVIKQMSFEQIGLDGFLCGKKERLVLDLRELNVDFGHLHRISYFQHSAFFDLGN